MPGQNHQVTASIIFDLSMRSLLDVQAKAKQVLSGISAPINVSVSPGAAAQLSRTADAISQVKAQALAANRNLEGFANTALAAAVGVTGLGGAVSRLGGA